MARGFESKSVESQQSEKQQPSTKREAPLTDDQREHRKKRDSLESSRRGLAAELEKSTSERRRADLANSIAHIDEELKKHGTE